jgi:hypothetical protein
MSAIFEVIDKSGRKLRMTEWNWQHIVKRHSEISAEKEKTTETLKNPDKIINSLKDEKARFYYKYDKHRKSINKFLMVLVKYLNGGGFIISAHFMRTVK